MRLCPVFLALMSLACAAAQRSSAAEGGEIKCNSTFRKPVFAEVDDFVARLQSRKAPWGRLVMPDRSGSATPEDVAANASKPLQVQILMESQRRTLVFVDNKPYPTAPFCALVFLLEKRGARFHVADFVRRSEGYESYSDLRQPTMLRLQPSRYAHFYFQEYLGGRKCGLESDEFFVVKDGRLRRTLFLKNVGAYLSPADPYGEFSQDAEVSVTEGRPRITITRRWVSDSGEQEQKFSVLFRWDSSTQRFFSPRSRTLVVKEPEPWTAKGLPKPPGE